MSPQLSDGRIIRVVNGNPQGYICGATKDPINGKVFVSASRAGVVKIEDTFVDESYDVNLSGEPQIRVASHTIPGSTRRGFLKVPPNKTLHLYWFVRFSYTTGGITTKEVDPASFDTATVKWSTQPALGNTIETVTLPSVEGFYSFSTGTTGAICLKIPDEGVTLDNDYFNSTEHPDLTKRPYIT